METAKSGISGVYDQWFNANTGVDLGLYSWSFSGTATLRMNGSRPGAEGLKFEFSTKQGVFGPNTQVVVPEPNPAAILGIGVALLVAARKRMAHR